MKMTKRIFSLALCLVLMMALALPAFAAATTYTLTIENDAAGHTYEAYQIFSGDLAVNEAGKHVLSNIEWGTGVTNGNNLLNAINENDKLSALHGAADAASLAVKLSALTSNSATVDEFAEVVGKFLNTASGTSGEQADGKYSITGLSAGYYLIKDQDNSLGSTEYDSYTQYIIRVLKDETVDTKGEVPKVDKTINDTIDGTFTNVEDFDINDIAYYKWEGTLPSNLKSYDEYIYRFVDTLPQGIAYRRIEQIYIEGHDGNLVHSFYDVSATEYDPDGVEVNDLATVKVKNDNDEEVEYKIVKTYDAVANTITVEFEDLLKLYHNILPTQKIVVKYTARVTRDALIADSMTNSVKIEYSNNPNGTGEGNTGTTPPDVAHAFTFELGVNKYDADAPDNGLEGAEFVLYFERTENDEIVKYYAKVITEEMAAAGVEINGTAVDNDDVGVVYGWTTNRNEADILDTDSDGRISLRGLDADIYYLQETKAPPTYNLMTDPVRIEIKASYKETTTDVTATVTYKVGNDPEQGSSVVDVPNSAGSTLPSTGGAGTTMFYVFGALLVAAAVVMLIAKRRVEE